ncbi:MAG: c-type cytochrome [Akkermansiaceae bacterium]|nr:c-type cytochrome [Akkermansiaceae bacterium]MDP4845759.1 c-type cytochrome [Akkermansiaceae bacterium]MDP4996344.1 c-type cytochrome [Akkermansiaceae bacterium]
MSAIATVSPCLAEVTDVTSKYQVAEGFRMEHLYKPKKEEGSWVAMTEDGEGRLIVADQYGGLFRATVPGLEGGETSVEPLGVPLGGAHGLLWHEGVLYVSVNESADENPVQKGVWMVKEEGDGWAEPILLKGIRTGSEHGVHSLVPSPDGEWIYLVTGNFAQVPEMDDYFPAKVWAEDQLLERNPDGKGHAANVKAPAGWIARFRPDGSRWELVAIGNRNTFDIAFHDSGELFSYDADMEYDFGMPWYRPTRIMHIVPGAEQGWRNGTGKFPSYYEDSIPSVLDIGPGSPTGMLAGRGFKAPAKYQQALYAFDWTFATIYKVSLEADGASFEGKKEEFLAGAGLPLTDGLIGRDGAMYFATGGRRGESNLWRVVYVGDESTEPVKYYGLGSGARDKLAEGVINPEGLDVDFAIEMLGSEDRTLRYLARAALERQPDSQWVGEWIGRHNNSWAKITGAMACIRLDAEKYDTITADILARLASDWEMLSKEQKINWLRVCGLIAARRGGANGDYKEYVITTIDSYFPSGDREVDFELARMLCYVEAPGIVGRVLDVMDKLPPEEPEEWLELVGRNSRYGPDIGMVMANHPPTALIHYLYCLRAVKGPWKAGERRRAFDFFKEIEGRSGGLSYAGSMAYIRNQIYENGTDEEKKEFAAEAKPAAKKPVTLPPVKGPGRVWELDDVLETVALGLDGRDKKNGKRMFKASMCSTCHMFGGEGGAQGPDLTNLAGRFTENDLARSIIHPSEVISDQYEFTEFTTHEGKKITGRVLNEQDEILVISSNPFDFTQQIELSRGDIASQKPSTVSPMPPGMINRLNPDELRDLFAYLLAR